MKLLCPHCGSSVEANLVSNITPQEKDAADFLRAVYPKPPRFIEVEPKSKKLGRPKNKPELNNKPKLPPFLTTRNGDILRVIGESTWQYKVQDEHGHRGYRNKPISKLNAAQRAKVRASSRKSYIKRMEDKEHKPTRLFFD